MPVGRSDRQTGKKYYDLQKYEPHQIKYIQCKINVKFPIGRLLAASLQLEVVGRLNSSFGVRRSSILKSVCVGSRHGFRHHEHYLCRSSENTHRRVSIM